ncbi:tripartite tricarboxylate transporter TctB family protein [Microbaculum marinum]|uniref:Tripartite tricarboxylate transporter TctB family protein n=1 Tax=Microbaculum marinum TaxID=1764581 RepID=A0AAW9RIQ2_9HYPH
MRRANVVSGVVLALFGLLMLLVVIPAQIEQGPEGVVSPRLVPNMMMFLVTVLSVVLVLTNYRPPQDQEPEEPIPVSLPELAALVKIAAVFAVSVGLYLLVSPLAAGAALVVGSLVVLGERRPVVIVMMPAALLIGLWLLFYKVLGTAIV